jgi:hypothetical protein
MVRLPSKMSEETKVLILLAILSALVESRYATSTLTCNTNDTVAMAKYMYVGQALESFAQAVRLTIVLGLFGSGARRYMSFVDRNLRTVMARGIKTPKARIVDTMRDARRSWLILLSNIYRVISNATCMVCCVLFGW